MNTKLRNVLATSTIPVLIGLAATAAFLNTGDEAVAKEQVAPNIPVEVQSKTSQVHHRTVEIDGQTVFYREAGPVDAPTVLLLHGFPTSSHMFRNLIPALADKWHVVAPDYPGYGQSSAPSVDEFEYTFDHMAEVVKTLLVWGKNDVIFPADGAEPYKRDLKDLEFHLLDTGHFALEEDGAMIASTIRSFLTRKVGTVE